MAATDVLPTTAGVIARNLAPLVGILAFGWSAQNVLVTYFTDTLFALGVMCAGLLRWFSPPPADEGWAGRTNGEAGAVIGGALITAVLAIPLGVPLVFMLGGHFDWAAMRDDPSLHAGLAWQAAAALWAYAGLYRALRTASPQELRIRRHFALVFLRWVALVILALAGVGFLFGRASALAFVAAYALVSSWAEIAPDRFLRAMPGGAHDADPEPPSPGARSALASATGAHTVAAGRAARHERARR